MSFRARITLLVLSHVGVLGAFLWFGASGGVEVLLACIVVSQPGLLALWAAFAGRPGPWRIIVATGLFTGGVFLFQMAAVLYRDDILAWAFAAVNFLRLDELPPYTASSYRVYDAGVSGDMLAVYVGIIPATSLGTLALRAIGVRVTCNDSDSRRGRGSRRLQFSLGWMFQWITVVAVFLGLISYASQSPLMHGVFSNPMLLVAIAILAAVVTLLVCVSLWIALTDRLWVLRVPIMTVCPLVALIPFFMDIWFVSGLAFQVTIILCSIATSMIYSLLLLRGTGLRATWRRRSVASEQQGIHASIEPNNVDPFVEGTV